MTDCIGFVLALALGSPSLQDPQGAQTTETQPPAQSQQAPLPVFTDRIEVVATRQPEVPGEVPAPVEVLSGADLRARGVTDLAGALTLAAGVDVAPGGDAGPAGSVPSFWGLQERDAFLLVVDGIPWGGTFNPSMTTLSLRDVERIEILRGPAPVTFGATSFVGVIHVVHKPGSELSRNAGGRFGSYGSGGAYLEIGLPFGSWRSRLTVDADRQGFSDDRTSFSRGHASWRAEHGSSDRRLWFSTDLAFVNQEPASPRPRQGGTLSPLVPVDANQNPDGAFLDDNRLTFAGGYLRPAFGGGWSTYASFAHGSQDIYRGFLLEVADITDNARGIREKIDQNEFYVDSHLAWPAGGHTRLVAGADFMHGLGDAEGADFLYTAPLDGSYVPVANEPDTLDMGIKDRREFFGGYAISEWTPTPQVKLTAGLRLNVTYEEREGEADTPASATADAGQSRSHVRPSGSLGALFGLWEQQADYVRAYANYSNTFKPAAVDFGLGEAGGAEEDQLLKPETSHSIVGGLKSHLFEGRLSWEAEAFLMDFDNLVLATSVNGVPGLMNAGKQRFKGVETVMSLALPHHWQARATYSHHDARFRDFVQEFDGVPTQLAGRRIEMSAANLASAGLVIAPDTGIVANLVVKYVGSRYLNKRNTALAEGFTTLDLGGGYHFGAWEIRVDGRNLTDRRDPVSESELGDAQYYLMTARRVDAAVAVKF